MPTGEEALAVVFRILVPLHPLPLPLASLLRCSLAVT
jgi:hypothetical protein